MKTYRPSRLFNVPFEVQSPVVSMVKGVEVKSFNPPRESFRVSGSYVTFGGSERVVNGLTVVDDTGTIECYFDPRIAADCRLLNLNTQTSHEVVGAPENIEGRNQFLRLRVQAVKGGA
jgi:hypothetical protein